MKSAHLNSMFIVTESEPASVSTKLLCGLVLSCFSAKEGPPTLFSQVSETKRDTLGCGPRQEGEMSGCELPCSKTHNVFRLRSLAFARVALAGDDLERLIPRTESGLPHQFFPLKPKAGLSGAPDGASTSVVPTQAKGGLSGAPDGASTSVVPTQAKGGLEWGTRFLLVSTQAKGGLERGHPSWRPNVRVPVEIESESGNFPTFARSQSEMGQTMGLSGQIWGTRYLPPRTSLAMVWSCMLEVPS